MSFLSFLLNLVHFALRSKTDAKPEPPKMTSPLLEFPVDIILTISDHLPAEDRICLALTCKGLFSVLGIKSRKTQLNPINKGALLERLEKDVPGVCYCCSCNKLIPFDQHGLHWRHVDRWMYEPKKVGLPGTIIETSRPVTFDCSMYTLRYNSARLVTNYGILGPRHGLPPSYLSYIFPTQLKYYGNQYLQLHFRDNDYTFFCLESSLVGHCVLRFESWEAKLVGPELYLSATYRWMQPDADNQALQDYLACKYLKVCKHATVSSASLSSVNLPPIARKSPDEADYHCTGSCKFCLTDWDASIEWISPTHGWMVTVTTYHDFGNCRSLSHWKWQAMTTELQDTKNRDKPSGAVKSRWLEG